jgi:hypothetical protein
LIVATAGAQLTVRGATIETNENVGVLIDGAATRATLDGCQVKGNRGRGVWIQGPVGAGAVLITGGAVSANRLARIGARDSSGLTLKTVTVENTQPVRVPIDLMNFEEVGDGVGLFSGARNATLEGVISRGNARTQVLADECGDGVQVTGGELTGGLFTLVVQRTASTVTAPAQPIDMPGRVLAVENKPLALPP